MVICFFGTRTTWLGYTTLPAAALLRKTFVLKSVFKFLLHKINEKYAKGREAFFFSTFCTFFSQKLIRSR